jgi:hypothetical protein
MIPRCIRLIASLALSVALASTCVFAEEVSPGGSSIKRYENVVPDESTPEHETTHVAEIENALKPFLGENYVYHEIISTSIHLYRTGDRVAARLVFCG